MKTTAEQMLSLTPNVGYETGILVSAILFAALAALVFAIEYGRIKRKRLHPDYKQTKSLISSWFANCLLVFCGLYLVSGISTVTTAKEHGLYQHRMTWDEILQGIENSPEEDPLPDDLSNCIVLYYKFGCEDCEAVYKDELMAFRDVPNVYWISTRSKTGRTLMEKYPVPQVPTGVYITENMTPVIKELYLKTSDEVRFHRTNANTLLDLQKSAKNKKKIGDKTCQRQTRTYP